MQLLSVFDPLSPTVTEHSDSVTSFSICSLCMIISGVPTLQECSQLAMDFY